MDPKVSKLTKIWPANPLDVIRILKDKQRNRTVKISKIVKKGHNQAAKRPL